ncbi:MAG: fatty acid-binding protein DegV [Firmicutes bacterium HGW-Firmicutes-1]|jgi:DegV family protein with EDD domain|nr:MAG: fatty acid-binding protein DegV [Firmicutes bacterium HGW-Firmicutes-1]
MKIKIITDSNCELSKEYIIENHVHVIPFYFQLGGIEYKDNFGSEVSYKEFYNRLRNGEMSTTTQITPFIFEEIFNEYINEGYDVIYLGFSSALSETFNCAQIARNSILSRNSDANITVFDTRSASSGQGLIVFKVIEMLNMGRTKEEIIDNLKILRMNLNSWFIVDNLEHLKRGGRISATNAAFGKIMEIKPILKLDYEGKIVASDKVRGRKKSIKALFDKFENNAFDNEIQTVFIHHADCLKDAESLKMMITRCNKVKEVIINEMGPIIGSHTGPGSIAIAFLGNQK